MHLETDIFSAYYHLLNAQGHWVKYALSMLKKNQNTTEMDHFLLRIGPRVYTFSIWSVRVCSGINDQHNLEEILPRSVLSHLGNLKGTIVT